MKLVIVFEDHDVVPPKLYDNLRRALVKTLELYGMPATVAENKEREMEAYQRFFDWNEKRIAEGG